MLQNPCCPGESMRETLVNTLKLFLLHLCPVNNEWNQYCLCTCSVIYKNIFNLWTRNQAQLTTPAFAKKGTWILASLYYCCHHLGWVWKTDIQKVNTVKAPDVNSPICLLCHALHRSVDSCILTDQNKNTLRQAPAVSNCLQQPEGKKWASAKPCMALR